MCSLLSDTQMQGMVCWLIQYFLQIMKSEHTLKQKYIAHAQQILHQNQEKTQIQCTISNLIKNVQVIHLHFTNISSTMLLSQKWDKDLLQGQKQKVFVFTAKQQNKGRGQKQNKWFSPIGNLYMTVLIKCSFQTISSLFIIASVHIAQTIKSLTGLKQVSIKWINDVFVKQSKISGILINTSIYGTQAYAQIGIGMNVGVTPIQWSTSLKKQIENEEIRQKITPQLIQKQLSSRIINEIKNFNQVSQNKILEKYDKLLKFKGEKIKIYDATLQNIQYTGKFLKINQYGFALIQLQNGEIIEISSGRMRI